MFCWIRKGCQVGILLKFRGILGLDLQKFALDFMLTRTSCPESKIDEDEQCVFADFGHLPGHLTVNHKP
jgi:hypothetical protein